MAKKIEFQRKNICISEGEECVYNVWVMGYDITKEVEQELSHEMPMTNFRIGCYKDNEEKCWFGIDLLTGCCLGCNSNTKKELTQQISETIKILDWHLEDLDELRLMDMGKYEHCNEHLFEQKKMP